MLYGEKMKSMNKITKMNIRKCRAEVPLSVWLRRSQKSRQPGLPTLDELPYKDFDGSPLSVIQIYEKFKKVWNLR